MQRLLYISPVLPRRDGHGAERRAFRVIEAFSHRYRVSLLTIARAESNARAAADAKAICNCVTVLPLDRWTWRALSRRGLRRFLPWGYYSSYRQPSDWCAPSPADRQRLADACGRDRFEVVHVHRLYMLPVLQSLPGLSRTPAFMDLDDIESVTRERLATLARLNGDRRLEYVMRRDADAYRRIERRELARFKRIFVCSETDRERLLASVGSRRVDVLPNVVEIPEAAGHRAAHAGGARFVFLFVGTFDYYPNRDAAAFLCREVVPLLRRSVSGPFQIRIVSDSLVGRRHVPNIPELSWAPRITDLEREYRAADAVIVPIRAGGGTRIKTLEAFAHRMPVISTAVGVEGLEVGHGEHTLIGETAADLAAHAAAIMNDSVLAGRLAARALALVRTKYSPAALRRHVEEVTESSLDVADVAG